MARRTDLKPRQRSSSQPGEKGWLTESLRCSLFTADPLSRPDISFHQLSATSPEQISERPAQNVRQEIGTIQAYRVACISQPGRVDIVLSMPPPKEPPSLINIGEFQDVVSALRTLLKEWWKSRPAVIRAALAPTLLRRFAEKLESRTQLRKLLPTVTFNPEHDQDILWQINRPRTSKTVEGLPVNRLAKWQVLEVRNIQIAQTGSVVMLPIPEYLIHLELDINTASDNQTPFDPGKLPPLVDELSALAQEIMDKGDTA
jgi:hypothetical protein